MTRRFWLSFVDNDKPDDQGGFLGVTIVEVTDADAAAAKVHIDREFPQHKPGAEWIAAAASKAWALGCNPGGHVATADITDYPTPEDLPLNRLLSKAELLERGLIETVH